MEISKRSIHLDFHTGPDVPGVGSAFCAADFAETMEKACVDGVTLFAMCHHGHLYYDTDHPARHPGLQKGFDLLGSQIEALHGKGIRAPVYISAQCNEYAANEHPEWIALTPELSHVKWRNNAFIAGWQILDMSSPYQDYLAEIIAEVLKKYAPVDGLFIDMCWDQPSCSKWAMDGMRRKGYDPREEADRKQYAREVAYAYMERFNKMLADAQGDTAGIWFNSRGKTGLNVEKQFLKHIEIESLPTGGWGYAYFPYVARYVRPLGLPALSHTARFFKSWGDNASLKPDMALKYELCQMLSQNVNRCSGDVLPPNGVLCKPAYDLIGKNYAYIKRCEPYVEGMEVVSQIAVVTAPELGDNPGPSLIGAMNALRRLKHQFDVVPPEQDLSGYELAIVPEAVTIGGELKLKLQEFVKNGGALIISGAAAVNGHMAALPEQGIACDGMSPFSHVFLHAGPEISKGLYDYGYVCYDGMLRIKPAAGAQGIAAAGEPYFERGYARFCGHDYTPESHISQYAAIVQKGRVITFAAPLFLAYGSHAAPNCRALIGNCIDRLIEPYVTAGGPSFLEAVLMKNERSAAVHLLSFIPERRADGLDIVEDAIPVNGLDISVKYEKRPVRVYLAPETTELPFEYKNGRVNTVISFTGGHAMLMIE